MTLTTQRDQVRATWSAGDYDAVVDNIWPVGGAVVQQAQVRPGDHVLDVACGSGNAAIQAAQSGGTVTGIDLTPELFEAGRHRQRAAGVEVDWQEGDAQDIPFADAMFDVVLSTFGCMFAPDHARTAAELVRVLRPGGRLAVAAWTPDGWSGRLFATTAPYQPPPPTGFQPPVLWGTAAHARDIFAAAGLDIETRPMAVELRFDSLDTAAEDFAAKFGPLVMLRRRLEPEGRWAELFDSVEKLFKDAGQNPDGSLSFPADYLLIAGTKAR